MGRIIFLSLLVVCLAVPALMALPLTEYFSDSTIVNTYEQFWTLDATLESVPGGTDGIPDAPGGNGYIGKMTAEGTAATTSGQLLGEYTDVDYTVQSWLWTPVVNTADPPDNYWYQMLVFYRITDAQATTYGYGRLHTQFNLDTNEIAAPRIRLQFTIPGFVTAATVVWTSPTDFTHSEGWHKLKVEITGTTANCYYDDSLLGSSDWTSTVPERTAGKCGIGQYVNAAATRSIYIDNFKAWTTGGSEPADPTPTPPPLNAQNWTYYE